MSRRNIIIARWLGALACLVPTVAAAAPPTDDGDGFTVEEEIDTEPPPVEDDGFALEEDLEEEDLEEEDPDVAGVEGTVMEAAVPEAETPAAPTPAGPPDDADDGGDWAFEVEDISDDPEALAADLKEGEVQATGKVGTLTGVVLDTKGDPVPGAYVEAVGAEFMARAGIDGRYSLDLPPGTYTIVAREELHEAIEQPGVEIRTKTQTETNFTLVPQSQALVVQVEADANVEGDAGVMIRRQKEVASSDRMSREEISRSGGGSLANVARFIVGATVVGGRFVFVRGLGHRYGNTLLDGARVPSPEPDLRTVPLDIFPSGALGAINVQKSFTPDVPGDFAGGSIQLVTREIPRDPTVSASVEVEANSATTGRPMLYSGAFAGADAFGFGNRPRGLSDALPATQKVGHGLIDTNTFEPIWSPEQVERHGESMYTDYRVRRGKRAPFNGKVGLTLGDSWATRGGGRFGLLASANYSNKHQSIRETVRQYGGSNGEIDTSTPQVAFQGLTTTQAVRWSGLGLARWDINDNHRVEWTSLYSRDSEDETREQRGIAPNVSGLDPILATRLRYIARSVSFNRLGARHRFPIASGKHRVQLDYFGSYSLALRDDPSIRSNLYLAQPGCDLDDVESACDANLDTSSKGNAAGDQVFMRLRDDNVNGAANLEVPFDQWSGLETSIKFGAWGEGKWRDFGVRRFDYRVAPDFAATDVPGGTGNVINDNTIGGGISQTEGATEPFVLRELTRSVDNYRATQKLYAGYAMLTLPFVNWLKFSGGARLEWSDIDVRPYDIFEDASDPAPDCATDDGDPTCLATRLAKLDVLPAAAFIVSPKLRDGLGTMNVRIMGSGTVARPEFRELAPFAFTDFVGGFTIQGNEDLQQTRIWNGEVRWEWFPRPTEVIAVTGFYKNFQKPIEQIANSNSPPVLSFVNAKDAHNIGAELELRKGRGFLVGRKHPSRKTLDQFAVGSNFAYVFSRVNLRSPCHLPGTESPGPDFVEREDCRPEIDAVTSRSRPLQGQSPYVLNAFLDYTNDDSGTFVRALFNTFGRRIYAVSTLGLPDIYEEPVPTVDFVFSQRLFGVRTSRDGDLRNELRFNFGVTNLLNTRIRRTQGDDETLTYGARKGVSVSTGLSWSL